MIIHAYLRPQLIHSHTVITLIEDYISLTGLIYCMYVWVWFFFYLSVCMLCKDSADKKVCKNCAIYHKENSLGVSKLALFRKIVRTKTEEKCVL